MGVRQFSGYSNSDVSLVTVAETVIASVTGVSTAQPGQAVAIRCNFTITTGGSTTALTMRVRRDGLAGALVGEAETVQISTAAGSTEEHSFEVEDIAAGEFSGRTYVCTVTQVGAAANGSVLQTEMVVTVTP